MDIAKFGLHIILKLLLISTISFFILYLLPGNPARIILGPQASQNSLEEFSTKHGLDKPIYIGYLNHVKELSQFELGISISKGREVKQVLYEPLIFSIKLLSVCALIFLFFSLFIPYVLINFGFERFLKWYLSFFSSLSFFPTFLLASLVVIFASKTLFIDLSSTTTSIIIGSMIICLYPISLAGKMFQESIARECQSEYYLRSESQGFVWKEILKNELLPNSLSSYLGVFANSIVYFITGSLFIEVIIGLPGIGKLTIESLQTKDIPLIHGCTLIYAFVAIVVTQILEFTRKWIAPTSYLNSNSK